MKTTLLILLFALFQFTGAQTFSATKQLGIEDKDLYWSVLSIMESPTLLHVTRHKIVIERSEADTIYLGRITDRIPGLNVVTNKPTARFIYDAVDNKGDSLVVTLYRSEDAIETIQIHYLKHKFTTAWVK